jgi:hypothetical protein
MAVMAGGYAEFSPPSDRGLRRPRVRLSAIGEGWELLQDRWGTWVVASFIVLFANSVVSGAALSLLPNRGGNGLRIDGPADSKLITCLINGIIIGFFYGGMFRMACLQVRGKRVAVSDLFGVTDVLWELVVGSAIYALICFVAASFCVLPYFVAAGVLMFTGPLIVDLKLTGPQAIAQSWHALKGEWFRAAVFHFFATLISSLGIFCCGVGIFFTMPIYCLSIAVLYRDFFLVKDAFASEKPFVGDPDF